MQFVLYRPMAADYPAKLTGSNIFAANIIPAGYRGFPADGSFAAIFYDRFYIFPPRTFPRQETQSILLSPHVIPAGFP
jgi:hypothetical protein